MVHLPVRIEPFGGNRVRGVHEKGCGFVIGVTADDFEGVAFDEREPLADSSNFLNAAGKGFRIPAGIETTTVLTSLHKSRALSHDAASLDAVPEDDCKGALTLGCGFFAQNGGDIGTR